VFACTPTNQGALYDHHPDQRFVPARIGTPRQQPRRQLPGDNFRDDIDALNRSLATLGEELDDEVIGAACRSEHVAG
jgi:hypothetical protein